MATRAAGRQRQGQQQREPRTVERKIHFYRVSIGVDENDDPIPFPTRRVLEEIDALDFENGDRYLPIDGDVYAGCWVDASLTRLRFANVRRSGLPPVDLHGQLSPLELDDEAGLVESIHVSFFPNNIVGAVFNFYGPRMSRLAYYLRVKAPQTCAQVHFSPLLRRVLAKEAGFDPPANCTSGLPVEPLS